MGVRTDSTHALAATRTLNRFELVGETVRAALKARSAVVPDWVQALVPVEWDQRSGRRLEDDRLPPGVQARDASAQTSGLDACSCSG